MHVPTTNWLCLFVAARIFRAAWNEASNGSTGYAWHREVTLQSRRHSSTAPRPWMHHRSPNSIHTTSVTQTTRARLLGQRLLNNTFCSNTLACISGPMGPKAPLSVGTINQLGQAYTFFSFLLFLLCFLCLF